MTFPLSGLVDVYTNQVPFESDVLRSSTYRMADVGQLLNTILATGLSNAPLFSGLSCAPVSPTGLQVVVGPGCAYSWQNYLPTSFSVLPADTNPNHNLYKQGILFDPVTLNTPAPSGGGNSVIYLIEAIFQSQDVDVVSRPYYNSADPTTPIFASLSDTRVDTVALQSKSGTPAPSPTPPTPDAGYTGLYYVTVANGQTSIISGNISVVPGAPFITESLTQKISYNSVRSSQYTYYVDTGAANALVVTPSPAYISTAAGTQITVKAANSNTGATTLNVGSFGAIAVRISSSSGLIPLSGGEIFSGVIYNFVSDGTFWQLTNPSEDIVGSFYAQVYDTSGQTIAASSTQKVTYNSVEHDPNSWWNVGSNRFIPTIVGAYSFAAIVNYAGTGNNAIAIYKNGSLFWLLSSFVSTGGTLSGSAIIPVTTIGDYFEIFMTSSGGANLGSSGSEVMFQIAYIGN